MIIGISGKIGSGKDTVGKIIQNLTKVDEVTIESQRRMTFNTFEIKKFAGVLKDYICMATGCTREQLEDRDFKDKELGKEWNYIKIHIKTTDGFNLPYFYTKLVRNEEELREWFDNKSQDEIYIKDELIKPTYRSLMLDIGTGAMRNNVHPDFWVLCLMSSYIPKYINKYGQETLEGNYTYYKSGLDKDSVPVEKVFPKWIITDVRFPNELKAINNREGFVIRVNRPKEDKYSYLDNIYNLKDLFKAVHDDTGEYPNKDYADKHWLIKEHESETALDNAEFKYTINNDGTIDDLVEKVREILIKEKII